MAHFLRSDTKDDGEHICRCIAGRRVGNEERPWNIMTLMGGMFLWGRDVKLTPQNNALVETA
jgi:hypothetical protein